MKLQKLRYLRMPVTNSSRSQVRPHLLIAITDALKQLRSLRVRIRIECYALVINGYDFVRHGGGGKERWVLVGAQDFFFMRSDTVTAAPWEFASLIGCSVDVHFQTCCQPCKAKEQLFVAPSYFPEKLPPT